MAMSKEEINAQESRYHEDRLARATMDRMARDAAAMEAPSIELVIRGKGSKVSIKIEGKRATRASYVAALTEAAFKTM